MTHYIWFMKKLLIIAVIAFSCTANNDRFADTKKRFELMDQQYKKDSLTRDFNLKMEVQRIKKK